jgi:hypothetical protein
MTHTTEFTYTRDARANPNSANIRILTACRIARRYRDRIPAAKQLMNDFGMSRATAYRWIAALQQARGEPA